MYYIFYRSKLIFYKTGIQLADTLHDQVHFRTLSNIIQLLARL